uniref:D-alanine--D-alanine ligase n=1 Tax=Candidatus Kentrum sp. LFY TaxID=2126342 RepID=A0A450ULU4_9GAMM|nr:MAG: D-alanine-D-alanine ligase [Candidatus Kentron sp. LFY]VFJ93450.1 MAG: D-alanine-D-alanine ligase [Candidatus Kentron sp. LFY]VFK18506.1 MAG: D-alanine-D-alanine ligase [Candidatus Kentron sp. LFY]
MEIHIDAPSVNHPAEFGKVAVVFGGVSAERVISLESGQAVLDALHRKNVDAYGLDAGEDVLVRLMRDCYDRVFVVLHGRGGEDGTLQGVLETIGIPYTGSGILGSALSMDKARTKYLWQAAGIPTPPFRVVRSESELIYAAKELGLPVIVKPIHEGSSIGISKITNLWNLDEAWFRATHYDSLVLVERWIDGMEYTASILKQNVFPLIRLETPRIFYDFEAKYSPNVGTQYYCPCGLSAHQEEFLRNIALRAFEILGGHGWGRVDFLCDASGEPWFIEINTVPGMTDRSLVPMAARSVGISFDQLVWQILETSL